MYTFFIVLIVIASVLMILAVLVQSPKGGMAANFGASNQVMGVRQTSNFLEKFTWNTAIVIAMLCVASTLFIPSENRANAKSAIQKAGEQSQVQNQEFTTPEAGEEIVEIMELPKTDSTK